MNVQIISSSFFAGICNKVAEFLAIIDTGSTTTVAGQVAAETEIRHTTGKQVHLAVATQQAEVAAGVMVITGIVQTIRKHVIAQQTLAGRNEYVGVEEPAPFGGIIPALEIIQPGLLVIDVATIAQRIECAEGRCHGAADRQNLAPGIVIIADHDVACQIHDDQDIALQGGDVIVRHSVPNYNDRRPGCVIDEGERIAANGHPGQLRTIVDILISGSAVGSRGSHLLCSAEDERISKL